MTTRFFILTALVIPFLAACGGEKEATTSDAPRAVSPPTRKEGKLTAALETGNEPNQYSVRLEFPKIDGADRCRIDRFEDRKPPTPVFLGDCGASPTQDKAPPVGTALRYELVAVHAEDGERVGTDSVLIPRDLELRTSTKLSRVDSYGRLYLRRGAALWTDGEELTIDVEELRSDDGIIGLFAEDRKQATEGVPGQHAAAVTIRARRAIGALHLVAVGQQGGSGRPGAAGVPGMAGARGVDGTTRVLPGIGKTICERKPGNGSAGSDGTAGGDGSPGREGGASPRLLVVVQDPSDFRLLDTVDSGSGGRGGLGGLGGIGGAGGAPGHRPDECPAASAGPVGNAGASGKVGSDGKAGVKKPWCFVLGSARRGECDAFGNELKKL